jgi:cellulose synthase/poly-beta-1,6-N-acetylglucosamine synthase-like glycosyltransferase
MSTALVAALGWALAALCIIAALPVLVLLIQVALAGSARVQRHAAPPARDASLDVAVLIPAHNEALGIATTVRNVRAQLRCGDRVLVVADNCSDATAAVARDAGAEVIERTHATERGKGYALDFGTRHLALCPPAMVLIVDADCMLDPGSVEFLADACRRSERPAQALDEMEAPAGAGLRARVSAFAWRVRNRVRPLGWRRVGVPCQIMGTGVAFPWPLLRDAPLASGYIVEDVKLGVDLALAGHPPVFEPRARVSSAFPVSESAASAQRRRWEHGNMAVMLRHGPRLLWAAVRRGDARLAAMAADLMVPPLALLTQLQVALLMLAALGAPLGAGVLALGIAGASLAALTLTILRAWHIAGQDVIGWSELVLTAPAYGLRKLPMYIAFLWKRESSWVRAKREGE